MGPFPESFPAEVSPLPLFFGTAWRTALFFTGSRFIPVPFLCLCVSSFFPPPTMNSSAMEGAAFFSMANDTFSRAVFPASPLPEAREFFLLYGGLSSLLGEKWSSSFWKLYFSPDVTGQCAFFFFSIRRFSETFFFRQALPPVQFLEASFPFFGNFAVRPSALARLLLLSFRARLSCRVLLPPFRGQ